jgi:hypothetical protein
VQVGFLVHAGLEVVLAGVAGSAELVDPRGGHLGCVGCASCGGGGGIVDSLLVLRCAKIVLVHDGCFVFTSVSMFELRRIDFFVFRVHRRHLTELPGQRQRRLKVFI